MNACAIGDIQSFAIYLDQTALSVTKTDAK
jgi:hypothetical protein